MKSFLPEDSANLWVSTAMEIMVIREAGWTKRALPIGFSTAHGNSSSQFTKCRLHLVTGDYVN
jgi:hypothetical protein